MQQPSLPFVRGKIEVSPTFYPLQYYALSYTLIHLSISQSGPQHKKPSLQSTKAPVIVMVTRGADKKLTRGSNIRMELDVCMYVQVVSRYILADTTIEFDEISAWALFIRAYMYVVRWCLYLHL